MIQTNEFKSTSIPVMKMIFEEDWVLTEDMKELSMKISRVQLFFLIALAFRLVFAFVIPPYGDACRYLVMARNFSEDIGLLFRSQVYYPPPLFQLVAALFFTITKGLGVDYAADSMKLVSPLFGSMTIPVVYLIGKRLFNQKIGEYAAVLLALNPIHIIFSSLAYTEVFFTFWVSLCLLLFIQVLDDANLGRSIMLGISIGFAGLSKQLGPILFLVFPASLVFFNPNKVSRSVRRVFLALLIGALILSPFYLRSLLEFGTLVPEEELGLRALMIDGKMDLDLGDRMVFFSTEPKSIRVFMRVVGTYYEYWGIVDGKITTAPVAIRGIPVVLIWLSVLAYGILALYPTILHIIGIWRSWKQKEARILHLLLAILLVGYAYLFLTGEDISTVGFRKPLFPAISGLSIFAAIGLVDYQTWLNKIPKKHSLKSKLRFVPIAICFMVFVTVVVVESVYLRQRYARLTDGAEWLRINTDLDAVVLTSRPSEIAYYSGRVTVDMKELRADRFTVETFEKYRIRYILIPDEDTDTSTMSMKMQIIRMLEDQGVLRTVYQTAYARIWKLIR